MNIDRLVNEIERLFSNIDPSSQDLRTNFNRLRNEINILIERYKHLEAALQAAQNNIDNLHVVSQDKDKINFELNKKIKPLEEEKEKLEKKLEKNQESNENLIQKNVETIFKTFDATYKNSAEGVRDQIDKYLKKIQDFNNLNNQIHSLNSSISIKDRTISSLQGDIGNLKDDLQRKTNQMTEEKTQLKVELEKYKSKLIATENDNISLKKRLADAENENRSILIENGNLIKLGNQELRIKTDRINQYCIELNRSYISLLNRTEVMGNNISDSNYNLQNNFRRFQEQLFNNFSSSNQIVEMIRNIISNSVSKLHNNLIMVLVFIALLVLTYCILCSV